MKKAGTGGKRCRGFLKRGGGKKRERGCGEKKKKKSGRGMAVSEYVGGIGEGCHREKMKGLLDKDQPGGSEVFGGKKRNQSSKLCRGICSGRKKK